MGRRATGQVVIRKGKGATTYALRFRAYGARHYLTLGTSIDGWNHQKAEAELENVLADVRRGIWQAPRVAPAVEPPRAVPTFHEFASEWYFNKEPELAPK